MGKFVDLTGKKFGKLTVLKRSSKKSRNIYYDCQCECGRFRTVVGWRLTNGEITTCKICSNPNYKNIANQKFGKLTAIKDTGKRTSNRSVIWECICECGNIIEVDGTSLRTGHTTSCGCINYSIGEKNIENILKESNIKYIKEYKPVELKNKRFDFAILDNDNKIILLIEFDGRQHYDINTKYYSEKQHQNDIVKNQWCQNNHIPLIRIPYTERDKITLDTIFSEHFLVKPREESAF